MSKRIHKYVDEYENAYFKDELLGQGGQGIVFRTKDPDLAIKLVTDSTGIPIHNKQLLEQFSKRFRRVRLLPIPERLNLAMPVALLQNAGGYVMQLLSDMVPFSHFWLDGKSAENITSEHIPSWLSAMPEEEAKKIVHYYKTGGLRRRLQALYKSASLLARLHAKGMVYGDISPNNIFISQDLDNLSVWLIDADNIRFELTSGGSCVYTPKYGAPELVQGKDSGGASSDCYAFAVMAFYLLALIHPFIGKKVDGEDEGDWADDENTDEDIEDRAYAGFLPWIDDQNDDSNSSAMGLPRSLLLTEKLIALFEGTLGSGRTNPSLRPSIFHWPKALAQAADMVVNCSSCSMGYYYDFIHQQTREHNCPYCKTQRSQLIIIETYLYKGADRALQTPSWRYTYEISKDSEISIPRRVFTEFTMTDSDVTELIISLSASGFLLKKAENSEVNIAIALESHQQGNFQKLYSQLEISLASTNSSFWIFADLSSPRLIKCMLSGGDSDIERYKC